MLLIDFFFARILYSYFTFTQESWPQTSLFYSLFSIAAKKGTPTREGSSPLFMSFCKSSGEKVVTS